MIRKIHGIMLSGGSAFGLRTADGAMRYLAANGHGFDAGGMMVPIVPAAVIFDLTARRNNAFPSEEMGFQACQSAGRSFAEGLTGAGRGATVGKILGPDYAMSGGIASCAVRLPGGAIVGAIVVVNALGDIINPANGRIIAGVRTADASGLADTLQVMLDGRNQPPLAPPNTTLAVVATDAAFDKEQVNKIAQMAQNGIARTTRPAHTLFDGDIVFGLSCGDKAEDLNLVGEIAARMVSEAIIRAVTLSNDLKAADDAQPVL